MPNKSSFAAIKRAFKKRALSSSSASRDSVLDSRPNKRARVEKLHETSVMDRFKKMQCSVVLKRLLVHPDGVHFKKAKALASKPSMDLESVQLKLWKDLYTRTDQISADIRTVFHNAMLCYPFRHEIHRAAATLSEVFETKWKDLEGMWVAEKAKKEVEPLKSNEGEKGKPVSDSDFSVVIANAKLQVQRKKEREMMQKMERTIFFDDDNFKCFQDLENLCGYSLTHYWRD
ncbi:hypothetical protein PIB30_072321 [Stylosanthes scabra]|uniref:Bromo domain-containing protein n=1 Tax=Stylosanthes scabra TaxID=79078 RepID=A0ABU6SP64_9FABA|nr:hypothetical protein [Stylosanthes scabra]